MMLHRVAAAIAAACLVAFMAASSPALAQGCGQQNPNCIVPTAPPGTSNGQAASTAFVGTALGNSVTSFKGRTGAVVPQTGDYSFSQIATTPTTLAGYGITNARTQLSADQTYYVNASSVSTAPCGPTGASTCQPGSDSNTGLSPSSPWLTVQHAINVLNGSIDFAGFTPIISLAHGSSSNYAFTCTNGPWLGNIEVKVQGDTSAPTAVGIIAPNSGYGAFVKDQCVIALDSLQITDAGTAAGAIHVGQLGVVDVSNVTFGAFNSSADHVFSESPGAKVNILAGNSIGGGAGHFIDIQAMGTVDFNGQTVAIPVAKAFTQFAFLQGPAEAKGLTNGTFTGAGVAGTTGTRAVINGNAYVSASGNACNSVFPGNANCQITQGGQDDAADSLTTPWSVANGGTGNATQTSHSILLGEGTSPQGGLGPCTTNQIPIYSAGSGSDPACGSVRQNVSFSHTSAAIGNATFYCGGQGCQSAQASSSFTAAIGGTFKNLTFTVNAAPGAAQTYTVTLFSGSTWGALTATAVTCTISGASTTSCSDSTHAATVTAGQYYAVQIVGSAGATASDGGGSFGIEFDNP